MKLKRHFVVLASTILIGMVFVIMGFKKPNVDDEIFIHERISSSDWIDKSGISGMDKFIVKTVCCIRRIHHLKAGRYMVSENENVWGLLTKLRSGNQDPIKLRIGNLATLEDLSATLSKQLKFDSATFQNYFSSDTLTIGSTGHQCVACNISPDDYEFYWTITPEQFIKKMVHRRNQFWTAEKLQRAQEIGLTPDEVCILASIVKAESGNLKEISRIAGLYMNRLKIKMPLQSDPTVIFGKKAARQKRVSFNDLEIESPYNTYKIVGLPPGPICLVENQYLDAVLQYEKHNYIYMCAVPGGIMAHTFSDSYSQHLVNANAYRKWLDNKKIH